MDGTIETTDDTLLGGRVRVRQPKQGYRVGLEAPLLAAFALGEPRKPPRHIVDLGAGVGSVGLCASHFCVGARLTLVEDEPATAVLARVNLEQNGLSARGSVVVSSVTQVVETLGRGVADLVLTNPPWFDEAAGHVPDDPRRRRARMLGPAGVAPFLAAGRQLLGRGGRLCIAFPAPSLAALFRAFDATGLVAKRMRFLHGRATANADVVFVEAMPAKPGGLRVQPAWLVRTAGEAYTDEIAALLRGEPWPRAKTSEGGLRTDLRPVERPPRYGRWGSQVVRQWFAKPSYVGSNPILTSSCFAQLAITRWWTACQYRVLHDVPPPVARVNVSSLRRNDDAVRSIET